MNSLTLLRLRGLLLCGVFAFTLAANQESFSFEYKPNKGLKGYSGKYDDWWQAAIFYQIYPRSFKDSDGDGDGDIQGIIQKLDHFTTLGIDAVWLSPIYKSPQVDNGYDISDYRDIDSMYGTLSDLKELLERAHERGLKIILDYVPNHTSDQHEWFKASVNRTPPYDEYYIWHNATYVDGERLPPNNWLSTFRGSAWEWNEERQQYYYHQFAPAQPDLNYRNPAVVQEMKDILTYWLDFGVDGFRMDAVPPLFEDELFRDEPASDADNLDPDDPGTLNHIYTTNLNETYDMIYQWREHLDNYSAKNGSYSRVMMTEVYSDVQSTMRYYVNDDHTRKGAHFTFNFITFIENTHLGFSVNDLFANIFTFLYNVPEGCIANWVLGNHDQRRVATRLGVDNIDLLNILAGLLPGVQVTYQGEEIGQENGEVTCEQGYDPQAIKNCSTFNETSRDFERTPYQWDTTKNAGFSEGDTTWLPVSAKYENVNLEAEKSPDAPLSHYHIYQQMVGIRRVFKNTSVDILAFTTFGTNIFYLNRETDNEYYGIVFNNGYDEEPINAPGFLDNITTKVILTGTNTQYSIGDTFDPSRPLKGKETVLFKAAKEDPSI
ncbi:maltase 1-like [Euwallacea fornicatus]|uniref:maltase 1-like n=1 Tax=Euwallacea fornicatus TaxID=995702 RepID=UPI00338EC81D